MVVSHGCCRLNGRSALECTLLATGWEGSCLYALVVSFLEMFWEPCVQILTLALRNNFNNLLWVNALCF